jgi:hypothetical protein
MPRNAAVYTVVIAVLMLSGCESETGASTGAVSINGDTPIETGTSLAGKEAFRDIARESGLVFDHFIGASGEFYLPEIMGPGVALFDFDNDGDLDVFIKQGTMLDRDI